MLTSNDHEASWTLVSPWPEELAHWHMPAKHQVKKGLCRRRLYDSTDDRHQVTGTTAETERGSQKNPGQELSYRKLTQALSCICLLTYSAVIQMGRKHSPYDSQMDKVTHHDRARPTAQNQEETSAAVNSMRTGLSRSYLALLPRMSPWYFGTSQGLVLCMQWHAQETPQTNRVC